MELGDNEEPRTNGAAIIARLAHHDPMIVAEFAGATAKRIVARIRAEAAQMGEGGVVHTLPRPNPGEYGRQDRIRGGVTWRRRSRPRKRPKADL
jgi:predicted RecB family nuclease